MATKIEINVNGILQIRILQVGSAFPAQKVSFTYFLFNTVFPAWRFWHVRCPQVQQDLLLNSVARVESWELKWCCQLHKLAQCWNLHALQSWGPGWPDILTCKMGHLHFAMQFSSPSIFRLSASSLPWNLQFSSPSPLKEIGVKYVKYVNTLQKVGNIPNLNTSV